MIEYTLDENNVIIDVGGSWDEFALANEGPDVVRDRVLGRSLFEFVEGDDVVQLYHSVLRAARNRQHPISFTFRCDAPTYRRRMSFTVMPAPGKQLRIRTALIKEEERAPVPLLDRQASRNSDLVICCAVCQDIKSRDGSWVSIETESERQGWFESDSVPRLSHSYCPRCFKEQLELITDN